MGTTVSTTELASILENHVHKGTYISTLTEEETPWEDSGWRAWKESGDEWETVDGVGRVRVTDDFGGEGQGDNYYLVFEIMNDTHPWGNRFYMLPGYYTSFEGGEYDGDLYEVTPVQKTIIVWENV